MTNSNRLIIFDTTLRDGEQSPGASMTREEKLRIARQLERMKVDVIEAGFAAASQGDFESIRAIAGAVRESTICSLSRANDRDIARAAEALQPAERKRIHTFIATSPLHMQMKLRMTPEQVLLQAQNAVRYARQFTDDIEFSPEDGSRSDEDFLCRVLEAVIAEGATTINFPDTVGYAVPEIFGNTIKRLRERVDTMMAAGIARERLCIDPGFGFGKTVEQNYALLRATRQLRSELDLPVLAGLSRKSMLGAVTGRPVEQRLAGSIAGALAAVAQGAEIVRVHDVAETVDALKVWRQAH